MTNLIELRVTIIRAAHGRVYISLQTAMANRYSDEPGVKHRLHWNHDLLQSLDRGCIDATLSARLGDLVAGGVNPC